MKKVLLTMAALSLASFSFAQDFDFAGGDDFGSGSEESSNSAVTITGEVGAETRAWIGTENKDSKLYDTKAYKSAYDLSKTEMDATAYANLELNYDGDYTNGNLKLKLDAATLKDHPEDVIDEVSVSGSFKEGRFQLKAGKLKEVWGKGDKVHVLDNFNANDYTDFIFPDYIDRRLGEVMFKATANISWDYNIKLDAVYTPWMTPDRFAANGKLVPAKQNNITNGVTNKAMSGYAGYLLAVKEADVMAATANTLRANYESASNLKDLADKSGDAATIAMAEANVNSTQAALISFITKSSKTGALDGYLKEMLGQTYDTAIGAIKAAKSCDDDTAKAILSTGEADKLLTAGGLSVNTWKDGKNIYERYVTDTVTAVNTAQTLALSNMSALSSNSDALYPDTYSLRYGQAGLRFTGTAAGIDWGTSYYYGHYKQPSFNASKLGTYMNKYLAGADIEEEDKFLQYDQLQVFGLEAAFVVWKLNTRWEVAYNLTEDFDGTDPYVHNNSLAWVVGFDIDLPIHNLNLNVQETGSFVLKNNEIEDMPEALRKTDVDYNSDGKYIKNKVIMLLSDKFLNEKLTVEAQGIYGIECKEFVVVPKIAYNVSEGLTLSARGAYIYSNNENGEFYNFTADSENHDKAFFELSAKYQF